MCNIIGDYCGVINEESVRKNFLLIYELVDEVFVGSEEILSDSQDFGYPQETATESLKAFVANTPVRTDTSEGFRTIIPPILQKNTAASSSANKSVAESSTKEDIFVDLFEYVNVLFDSSVRFQVCTFSIQQGHLSRAQVEGEIKIRSFLKGNPKVKLSMNQDLVVGRETLEGNKSKHFVFWLTYNRLW
jgi:AP-4 complex subunit mu-1